MRVALIGYGNVARAFARLLEKQRSVYPFRIVAAHTARHGTAYDLKGLPVEPKFGPAAASIDEFLSKSSQELSLFMLKYTKEKDLGLFMSIGGLKRPANEKDIPFKVIVPAFAISELKRAFQIGFLLYIPFLVIDMVIASVLLSAGMMMLPPIFISLPFKLMLFVLVDGWNLLTASLVKGFF